MLHKDSLILSQTKRSSTSSVLLQWGGGGGRGWCSSSWFWGTSLWVGEFVVVMLGKGWRLCFGEGGRKGKGKEGRTESAVAAVALTPDWLIVAVWRRGEMRVAAWTWMWRWAHRRLLQHWPAYCCRWGVSALGGVGEVLLEEEEEERRRWWSGSSSGSCRGRRGAAGSSSREAGEYGSWGR